MKFLIFCGSLLGPNPHSPLNPDLNRALAQMLKPVLDPDPTPFLSDFKDAKILNFSYFVLITYSQAHYLQSLKPNADETAPKK
jgi:hypothetical protein